MKKAFTDLQNKSKEELQKEIALLQKAIATESIAQSVTMPKDTNALGKKKRRLAVVLTLLNAQA